MNDLGTSDKTSEVDSEVLRKVWDEYKSTESEKSREKLILHYSPLVKFVAGRVAAGLPNEVEQSDLISYGILGLIDAIQRFDPEKGFKFETYAIARIKGSMIDELRAIDWVPRSVRAKARSIEKAYAELEGKLKRSPTDAELAEALEMTEEQLASTVSQISFVGVVALDDLLAAGAETSTTGGSPLQGRVRDSRQDPVSAFETEEMRRVLADVINRLGQRERLVLTLYYYEGLTLAEIGEALNVTESRACQIHTKAILQLRSKMQEGSPEN